MNELTQTATFEWLKAQDLATRVAMVRDVTEIVRIVVNELFEDEVEDLAGARHSREKPHDGRYVRHGSNPGSIQIGEQRVPGDLASTGANGVDGRGGLIHGVTGLGEGDG